ncbi:MAG: long-chain fatty acid--CoA ligase [Bradymonadaceae bacterium]|nr:long-chain fatty acid--CoA ligase [Lujinxingiaceae bacterium]
MPETLLDLFERRVNSSGARAALRRKIGGQWEQQSWREWWDQSERIAAGLGALGIEAGDRVAILATTRIEWVWMDMAVAMAGAVVVPLYPASLPDHCGDVLRQCGVRLILVEDPSQIDKVCSAGKLPELDHIVYIEIDAVLESPDWKGRMRVRFDDLDRRDAFVSLEQLCDMGRRALTEDSQCVLRRRRAVAPDDLASIVFTAGSEGQARGVMLTHANFARQVAALGQLELFSDDDVHLLSLPLAHVFARMIVTASIGFGIETVFAESMNRLLENLREVEPTFMASVPRVFEKLMMGFVERAHEQPFRGRLFDLALEIGRTVSRSQQGGEPIGKFVRWEHGLISRWMFKEIHTLFGPRLRFLISGGAALPAHTAEFFHAAGVLILEGYGQTETTGALTFNLPDAFRIGTVGRPLPAVDVTIAEDGEVLVRTPTVMRGYFGADQASPVDAEGWLKTGDVGYFDRDGYLLITDRKKDVIVTSMGKVVAPRHVEALLEGSAFIRHAAIFGERRAFVSALVTLDEEAIVAWVKDHEALADKSMAQLSEHPRVHQLIEAHVQAVNRKLASFETIKKFAILERDFRASEGELTESGKIRRKAIAENFGDIVDSFYADPY